MSCKQRTPCERHNTHPVAAHAATKNERGMGCRGGSAAAVPCRYLPAGWPCKRCLIPNAFESHHACEHQRHKGSNLGHRRARFHLLILGTISTVANLANVLSSSGAGLRGACRAALQQPETCSVALLNGRRCERVKRKERCQRPDTPEYPMTDEYCQSQTFPVGVLARCYKLVLEH
eukprot:364721-Chlamydomonas_euryale.AAC.4